MTFPFQIPAIANGYDIAILRERGKFATNTTWRRKQRKRAALPTLFPHPSLQRLRPRLGEDLVVLLGDPDKRRSLAQFLEFGSSHVGAGGAQAPKDVQDGGFHIPFVWYLHSLAL